MEDSVHLNLIQKTKNNKGRIKNDKKLNNNICKK